MDKKRQTVETKPASSFLGAIGAIVWKDLAAELRSRELLSAMLVFALLVILIFNFALELDPLTRRVATPGILWATFTFAGTLGSAIYFGKTISNLAFMLIVEVVVLPVYSVLYNTNLFNPGLIVVILLGSVGYVAVGTLLSSMAVQTRTRDVLLPILLFPVVIPILIAAVKASSGFLQGLSLTEVMPYINLLIVYDVIFTAVAYMVFDYVVEE
jgi:heme exporter protein B